jgi:Tfp pilus assembly protein PilN
MIRINLLGIPRQKKGSRGAAAGATSMMPAMGGGGEGPSATMFLIAGLLIGLGGAGYMYWSADRENTRLQTEIKKELQEGQRLATVKTKYETRKKEAEIFEKRVKVIDQLRADQAGPVNLLNTVGETVNNTDAVWLSDLNEQGNNININGTALSTAAVANLMTNLKRSGYFKSVEIKDTTQEASKDMQSFSFTLVCEKLPKT